MVDGYSPVSLFTVRLAALLLAPASLPHPAPCLSLPLPGLLTEVQCKSKRLRKNAKQGLDFLCSIKLEDEGTESKQVSSTARQPAQVVLSHVLFLTSHQRLSQIKTPAFTQRGS